MEPPRYKCPKCRDKKFFIWIGNDGYEYAEPCECQRQEWKERAEKHRQEVAAEKERKRKKTKATATKEDYIPEGFEPAEGVPF